MAVVGNDRREELASFLRNRRERITPDEVGLAPGGRRRTPGLRREEVAQLAGVGVTWYTWLEQGRPINASVQVLDAIARVLKLGNAERWHLYRLADLPGVPHPPSQVTLQPENIAVLDALDPSPAAIYNGKYDLLASNEAYAAMFPFLIEATGIERNVLWQLYASPRGPRPVKDLDICRTMISVMRSNYAHHLGDPEWIDLIETLCAANPEFADYWNSHPVGDQQGMPRTKAFDVFGMGTVRVRGTGFPIAGMLDCRMVVYLPETAADVALIAQLKDRLKLPRRRPA